MLQPDQLFPAYSALSHLTHSFEASLTMLLLHICLIFCVSYFARLFSFFHLRLFFFPVSSCYFYTFWQSSYPAPTLTLFTYPHPTCWFGFSPSLLCHSSLSKLNALFQTSLAPNLNFSSFPCPRSCICIIPLWHL